MGKKTRKKKAERAGGAGRSKEEKKRRGRNLGMWILGGAVAALAFYYVDRSGAVENIDAVVVDTGTYTHTTADGSHDHREATVEYEGHRYTIQPADNIQLGGSVRVTIRRGRITGYPYFDTASRR